MTRLQAEPLGIQEIATITGLSKSTVSRALRGLPTVATATIDQVRRPASPPDASAPSAWSSP
ncbi:helix-turn-helix domain-containing protein [Curtobacterium sp. 'Ferrero']|uniref:helix-turn-helix domain-containing protein n=1 Tax=Curtobacterium sp. 'Ferrero' TaxID=2033654 RepID=UPI0020D00042|nr:helix-turn-helix domain-containing protein [Curtobacterium sp. 'Ferrero']